MNQRIAVRAIIKNADKALLLRRATGRPSILGKYELPGGRLEYGEQPEGALERYVQSEAGLTIQTAQLFDVVTYIDHDDRDIQYVFILYLIGLSAAKPSPTLGVNYDHYIWKKLSDVHQEKLTESSKLLLGVSQQNFPQISNERSIQTDVLKSTNLSHAVIYSDGGSRGNPGPSSAGFIILNSREEVIQQGGEYLGITTNNIAEYHGVRLGLEKALELGVKTVDFRIDSLLVVNQMNGIYTIKNRELWPLHERIKELVSQFHKVQFTHVRREFNQLADGMVNKILNAHTEAK